MKENEGKKLNLKQFCEMLVFDEWENHCTSKKLQRRITKTPPTFSSLILL